MSVFWVLTGQLKVSDNGRLRLLEPQRWANSSRSFSPDPLRKFVTF
jgi:hypothetical protein